METATSVRRSRAIGPVGTGARLVIGSGALLFAWRTGLDPASIALGLGAFPVIVLLLQRLRLAWSRDRLLATGPAGFVLNNALLISLLFIPQTAAAAALFLGGSMLLAAMRGYAGCEVLSLSNWLLRRDDQIGCVLFSPIDAIESNLTGTDNSKAAR